jgi:probable DNA repair protein
MPSSPALPRQVVHALENASAVITANQRAARSLRHAFDLRQRALGIAFWQPPQILAWDAWLASLWSKLLQDGQATDLLLNSTQEQTLWRAIIAADSTTASLRPVDALAQTAAEAWQRLHAYRGRDRLNKYPGNTDTRAFARWSAELERRCTRAHYLTEAQLPETLRASITAHSLTLQSNLLLVGFDSKTPAQIALHEAIQSIGAEVSELGHGEPSPSITLADAPDEYAELAACAHWLRTRLTEQPDSRVAVIVPAIETSRAQIDRVFRQTLAPELNDITSRAHSEPYEFSLGIPLAHVPLAATALHILRWSIAPLPIESISALLLSPYFATDTAQSEHLARAEFDAFVLRQQSLLCPEISLDQLLQLASGPRSAASLPILLKHLRALRPIFNRKDSANVKRSFGEWAAAIHELLEAANWAVPSVLDSIEFQARRKWESALDEVASLDFEAARVSFGEALEALERIAANTLFAPESRHTPVQIMGPLESAGSSFDAVWFLRANDLAWPSRPSPNPLLPWLLQRELAMPGTDSAIDIAHARRITERIAASAPTVLFSYARESADGPQRSSSALSGLNLDRRNSFEIAPEPAATALIELDAFADDTPIPPPPDQTLQGGAGILQAQAACGFRAFAEKRLFSSALDSASLGLDPSERGNLVHRVLEHFWSEVKNQAALRRMSKPERDAQLNRSIDIAFGREHSRPAAGWSAAYLDAERQRLLNLLGPWLDFEADKRSPFTVVSREEQLSDVSIGPLRLDIRVDRIDLVHGKGDIGQSPSEMIIDYKTGKASPADWLSNRPNEPQLPLYAVVSGRPHLVAIAFGIVRPGKEMDLCGIEAQEGLLPKTRKLSTGNFENQLEEWHDVLTALAEDFYSGHARVSPKSYPKTCTYCQQRLFCRLDPSALDADALESDEEQSQSKAEADLG